MKMIALWGSSGSGKSTITAALAAALAHKEKNVVVLSLDMKTPSLPLFLPTAQLTINHSIGEVLGGKTLTYDSLRSKIHIHPQSDRIGFVGMVSGENPLGNKLFEKDKIIQLLRVLDDSPFDYIIFDCDASTFYDTLTLLALEIADHVFRVLTPDVKGFEFEKSALSWMRNSENFAMEKHIKLLNLVYETAAVKQFAAQSEHIRNSLPFSLEVYNKFSAGELLRGFHDGKGQQFQRYIDQIVTEVLL